MLSIEKSPPDPPFKTSQDERLPEPEPDVDPSSSTLFDHSTFPKFSLRDYVFRARSKDIRNNWPFSLKNLQLCLKHGIKDLLPPFQPPDFVRNQSVIEPTGRNSTSEFQNISSLDRELSCTKEHGVLDTLDESKLDEKQVQTFVDLSSCRFEGEHGVSSTMTSVSQPQIELVSTSGPSSSFLKSDNLSETPIEVETRGLPASQKTESKVKALVKKCKLIRKSTKHFDQTSAADIATNFSTVSESMASKICPVCKTFSSSSNTTLNAHIDQCLSIEPTPKCTSNSQLTRYRIKPRKTKLMVDIYTTARMCTLEELDRRNGTTWATLTGLPAHAQNVEKCQMYSGGKKPKVVPVHPDDIDNAGAVYIDANGTKLRILSKFSAPSPLQKVQDDLVSRKFKGLKGRKLYSVKNNKYHASKRHKYFRVASQSSKFSSQMGMASQVQEGHYQRKGISNLEVHKIKKHAKPYDSGTLRQWACSKRTRVGKVTRKEGYQPSTFKWNVSQGMMDDTDRSILADSFAGRSQVQDQANFSEDCVSSPGSSERTDNTLCEAHISDKRGWSPVRKSLRSSFSGEMIDSSSPTQTKKVINHLREGSRFVGNNGLLKHQNFSGQPFNDYQSSDVLPGSNDKPSRTWHKNALKASKLSSSRRKKMLVSHRSSITRSKTPDFNRISTCETSGDHSLSDKSTECQSGKEEVTEVLYPRKSSDLKNRREREATSRAVALSSSESAPKYDRYYEKENMDSHVRMGAECQEKTVGLELANKEILIYGEDVNVYSSSKLALKESNSCFCKSMDSQFQKLNNNFKTRCGMLQSTQNCSWPLCGDETQGAFSESGFGQGQEMFFADEDRSAIIGHNVQSGGELDSDVTRGNSFFEVDPISIPGPPGSFLPSPRDMRSEEFQGNSSLSSSWVQSCPDQHDLIDGESSGSPISATSTISNSTASRSCFKYNYSSGVSDVFHGKLGSVSSNAGLLPIVENDCGLQRVSCPGAGRLNGDMFKAHKIFDERGSLSVIKDGQPCCCQRGDRISQSVNVNYQEPQLIRHHQALALETMPAMGRKQVSYSLNTRPNNLNTMPEGLSLSNCGHLMSENMGFPVMKSPSKSCRPLDSFPDPGMKFPRSNNCDSSGPSTPNPVLRLMGKNLMVVNTDDEDIGMPAEKTQPHPQLNFVASQVPTSAGGSSQNIQNQASCSFPHWTHQASERDRNEGEFSGQNLDVRLSKGFRNPANLNMPQTLIRGPAGLFLKQQTDDGFAASHAYKSDYNLHLHTNEALNRPEHSQNEVSMHNTNRTIKMPDHPQMNGLSSTNVIGDAPYYEDNLMANHPKYSGGTRMTQISTPGGSIPFTSSANPVQVNAFSCYHRPQDASPLGKPSPICNSSFQSAPTRQGHASPVKWDCNSETSYVCRRGVF